METNPFVCVSVSSPSLFPLSTHKNALKSAKHPTTQKQCQESIYYSAFRITCLPSESVQYWVIELLQRSWLADASYSEQRV